MKIPAMNIAPYENRPCGISSGNNCFATNEAAKMYTNELAKQYL